MKIASGAITRIALDTAGDEAGPRHSSVTVCLNLSFQPCAPSRHRLYGNRLSKCETPELMLLKGIVTLQKLGAKCARKLSRERAWLGLMQSKWP